MRRPALHGCTLQDLATGRRRWRRRFARDADPLANDNDGQLPTDVLHEILLRVPAKALCRLRLVCRSWRSLTSDPRFARAHSVRHPLFVALNCFESEIHIVDLYSGSIVKRIYSANRVGLLVHGIGDLRKHLSTQNGLVCVSMIANSKCDEQDIVLDPATDVVKILPDGNRESLLVISCILGHVPSTGEYKVLRLSYYNTSQEMRVACQVTALDSGVDDRKWRSKPSPVEISPDFSLIAAVDGIAYFYAFESSNDSDDDGSGMVPYVALFDLATEEWRPTTLSGPLSSHLYQEGDYTQFDNLDGYLVITHHKKRDCSTDFWFLMDVDNGPFWTKRYSMRCAPHWHAIHYPPCPLVILEDGRVVAWFEKQRVLRAYDLSIDTWEDLTELEHYSVIRMHQGSLLCSG